MFEGQVSLARSLSVNKMAAKWDKSGHHNITAVTMNKYQLTRLSQEGTPCNIYDHTASERDP